MAKPFCVTEIFAAFYFEEYVEASPPSPLWPPSFLHFIGIFVCVIQGEKRAFSFALLSLHENNFFFSSQQTMHIWDRIRQIDGFLISYIGIYCVIYNFITSNSINWFKNCHKKPVCPSSQIEDESIYLWIHELKMFNHIFFSSFLSLSCFCLLCGLWARFNGGKWMREGKKLRLYFIRLINALDFGWCFFFTIFYSFLCSQVHRHHHFLCYRFNSITMYTDLNWLMASYRHSTICFWIFGGGSFFGCIKYLFFFSLFCSFIKEWQLLA